MKKYENHVIWQFHIMFTFCSYYFHMFITFFGLGPRSGPQKSYFCHIQYAWAVGPVHSSIFETQGVACHPPLYPSTCFHSTCQGRYMASIFAQHLLNQLVLGMSCMALSADFAFTTMECRVPGV